MTLPSIILDTCALRDRRFTDWLRSYGGMISIPSVVYMEICRQYLNGGHTAEELDIRLKHSNIKILWFDKNNARIAAELMAGRKSGLCKECGNIDWIDTMVASYCGAGGYIITNNKGDFPDTGGFGGKIITTDELMSRL